MKNLFSLLRSAVFAALFIWLVMWLLPRWVGIHGNFDAPQENPLRWIGLIPFVSGCILMLTCVWRFGTTGEGTPMPPIRPVSSSPSVRIVTCVILCIWAWGSR